MHSVRDPAALPRRIAQILDHERREQGLTETQLGNLTGISQSLLGRYLKLKVPLPIARYDVICHALGLNVAVVMAQADAETPNRH